LEIIGMSLDPDALAVVNLIKATGRPPLHTMTVEEGRVAYLRAGPVLGPEPQPVAEVRDLKASGPGGDIPLRLYRGAGTAAGNALPCLVFFHGGGWVIGDLETHDRLCRQIANTAGCAIVAVDYRMGPEHRFPAAVDDCVAATQWIADHAGELGIDRSKLAVGGDSAGGNLSAVMAHMSRDGKLPPLLFQLLIYPATDLNAKYGADVLARVKDLPFNDLTIAWFVEKYADPGKQRDDWRASPLRAANFKGLPPAFVLTAGYDPLCAEGEAYAQKLIDAGGRVTRLHFSDQMHGFITQGRIVRVALAATDMAALALKRAFA
jgi:acetyl esterase